MNISNYDWLEKIYNKINFEKLPHGIIINGPDGIGKEILATHIAQELLLNKITNTYDKGLVDSNTHPDLFILNKGGCAKKIFPFSISLLNGLLLKKVSSNALI